MQNFHQVLKGVSDSREKKKRKLRNTGVGARKLTDEQTAMVTDLTVLSSAISDNGLPRLRLLSPYVLSAYIVSRTLITRMYC